MVFPIVAKVELTANCLIRRSDFSFQEEIIYPALVTCGDNELVVKLDEWRSYYRPILSVTSTGCNHFNRISVVSNAFLIQFSRMDVVDLVTWLRFLSHWW